MKVKQLKIINQDQSTEIADIGADAINVDYNDITVKAELDKLNTSNSSLIYTQNSLQSQINGLASGSPLVASSIAEMTNTTRVYVNTTNGYWYTYDGSTWIARGIYQSTSNSNDYEKQIKLVNYGTIVENAFVNATTGEIQNLNNSNASDFILILGGSQIKIENYTTKQEDLRGLAFYDENQIYISGIKYPSNSTGVTSIAPINAKYFRFTFHQNEDPIVTTVFKNENLISQLLDFKHSYDVTDMIYKKIFNRAFINATSGTVALYTNINMKYTEVFPINSDVILQLLNVTNTNDDRGLAFYDKDLYFISGQKYNNTSFTLEVPTTAKWVAFTFDSNMIIKYNTTVDNMEKILNNIGDKHIRPTDNTSRIMTTFNNLLAIGDSLTEGGFNHNESGSTEYATIPAYSYPSQMHKSTGITIDNMGQSGLTTKRWYETQKGRITSGHDCCIINLGANDTQANNMTVSLFQEYLQLIIDKVKEMNPKIKIFLVSLLPNYYFRNRSWYAPFRTRCKQIAESNDDCYFVDLSLYSDCLDDTVYSQGHLTALGYKKESDELIAYISDIIEKNIDDFKYIHFSGTDYQWIEG